MKNAPWGRLASRIRPKIRENPEDSRNSRPPSDRLLRPWMIQNCIVHRSRPEDLCDCQPANAGLWLNVLCRSAIFDKDRIGQCLRGTLVAISSLEPSPK